MLHDGGAELLRLAAIVWELRCILVVGVLLWRGVAWADRRAAAARKKKEKKKKMLYAAPHGKRSAAVMRPREKCERQTKASKECVVLRPLPLWKRAMAVWVMIIALTDCVCADGPPNSERWQRRRQQDQGTEGQQGSRRGSGG